MKRTEIALSSAADRMREIDAAFALGGLEHSPRSRSAAESKSFVPRQNKVALPPEHQAAVSSLGALVLRVPQWRLYPWLIHGFSTRQGGRTTIYREGGSASPQRGELNLGFTPTDTRSNVLKNREIFLKAVLGTRRSAKSKKMLPMALLRQIHSGLVHRVDAAGMAGSLNSTLRGDGLILDQSGMLIGIQTADCLPILVADVRLRVVAAFHAGWRGTLARIVERGVGRMRAEFGCRPEDLTAAIGPGIGRCCYSVGDEVRTEFGSQFSYADELFHEVFDLDPIKEKYPMLFLTARAPGHSNLGPSTHLDLAEANRRQLMDGGLKKNGVHLLGMCTACNVDQFFSHRAASGFTGRMLNVIGVQE